MDEVRGSGCVTAWEGGHDIGGIRHRIEMRYFGDRFDGGVESIERYRQQRLWSLEKREERREGKGNSLFLNLEELEGRDDVKGINRAKKERERAHSSVGREGRRKGATASRMDQLE